MSSLNRIFPRGQPRDGLAEEIRQPVEEKTEQLMRLDNLPRAEARQAALRALGTCLFSRNEAARCGNGPGLSRFLPISNSHFAG